MVKVMWIMNEYKYWDYELMRIVVCNYVIKFFLKFCLYKNFICFFIFILFIYISYYKLYIRLFW